MIKGISLQDHRIIKEQIVHSASDKLHNVVNRTVLMIRLVCPSEGAIRRKYSAEVLAQELERVQQENDASLSPINLAQRWSMLHRCQTGRNAAAELCD